MQAAYAFTTLLKDMVGPELKEHGFSKKGPTFYLWCKDNWGLINFQKSSSSTNESITFTVNLGVASSRLLKFFSSVKETGKPSIWDCHWRERLGILLPEHNDKWWVLYRETDLESLHNLLSRNLRELVIPEIARYIGDEQLRDLWLEGKSPGLTNVQRLLYLSVLLKALGPLDYLGPVLEELQRISIGTPAYSMVEVYLQKLNRY